MANLFVGALLESDDNAVSYLRPCQADGRYTKPESIAGRIQVLQEERAMYANAPPGMLNPDNLYHQPIIGKISKATVLGEEGEINLVAHKGGVGCSLVETLNTERGETGRRVYYGFGIKRVLRIAAFEALATKTTTLRQDIAAQFLQDQSWIIDPLDILLDERMKRELDIHSLLRYFDVEYQPEQLHLSVSQADICRELCYKTLLA